MNPFSAINGADICVIVLIISITIYKIVKIIAEHKQKMAGKYIANEDTDENK